MVKSSGVLVTGSSSYRKFKANKKMVGGGNAVIMHTSLEGPTRDIDRYF